jgi:hypothetical protein
MMEGIIYQNEYLQTQMELFIRIPRKQNDLCSALNDVFSRLIDH